MRRHTPQTSSSSSSQQQQPPVPISITICGDGGCGKSSITLRLVRSQWTSEYDPTIEDSYTITRRVDGVPYHLSLTDTAGQEEYRGLWASSNLGADAFLLVYDITARDTLDALQYFDELIDMEAETRADNATRARRAGLNPTATADSGGAGSGAKVVPPVKIVAGNKCDLQESRQVPAAVGLDWARRRGCGFMETSARLEVNIEETFALIVRRVMEARRQVERGHDPRQRQQPASAAGANNQNHHYSNSTSLGTTKPLSPILSGDNHYEKGAARGLGQRGPSLHGDKAGRGGGWFWRKLRCW